MRVVRDSWLRHVDREIKLEVLSSVRSEPIHRVSSTRVILSHRVVSSSLVVEHLGSSLVLRWNVMPSGRRSYSVATMNTAERISTGLCTTEQKEGGSGWEHY